MSIISEGPGKGNANFGNVVLLSFCHNRGDLKFLVGWVCNESMVHISIVFCFLVKYLYYKFFFTLKFFLNDIGMSITKHSLQNREYLGTYITISIRYSKGRTWCYIVSSYSELCNVFIARPAN